MKISRSMNLIVPLEMDDGKMYVHAAPISKEIFRQHFFILSKVYAEMFGEGLGTIGPRVAYMMLEKVAMESAVWEGEAGVKNTLVNEIIRLANLVYPAGGKGWEDKPLDVAIESGLVDPDEVLNDIVFFICICAVNKPSEARTVMESACGVWSSQITSLNVTDWTASLPISMQAGSSGETESTSSATSSTIQPESVLKASSNVPV
jgi:hypothetical protein